jgi:hypothetical protein
MSTESGMSAAEIADLVSKLPEPIMLHTDMPEETRKQCCKFARECLVQYKLEKDQARHVKLALEGWNGAMWMVVIGVSFGASVAHENHGLCMFRIGRVHFMCFQSYDEGSLINTKKATGPKAQKSDKKGQEEEEGGEGGEAKAAE